MSKKDDPNIIKHELLNGVITLKRQTEIVTVDHLLEYVCNNKYISAKDYAVKSILLRLHADKFIIVEKHKMDVETWFIKELSSEGIEALVYKTFLKEYRKEKRKRWNETGQILSPYISITALLITSILFVVDKCSQPKSYELTVGNKDYILKEK